MQKVAKELLPLAGEYSKDIIPTGDVRSVASFSINELTTLIHHRQAKTLLSLAEAMSHLRKDDIYEAWMQRHADLIQHVARAWGERICWDAFLQTLSSSSLSPSSR